MRITQDTVYRTQLAGINNSLTRLQTTQEQMTSGKRLNRPSDSPVDTVSAMRLRAQQSQLAQFGENIDDGLDRLNTADAALTTAAPMLTRVRTLTLQASNATNGPTERTAIAKEIRQIQESLKEVANTQFDGRAVFGGTAYSPTSKDAYDATTGAWRGNSQPVLRKVTDAPGAAGVMDVGVSGADVFGTDLFSTGGFLDTLATEIENGNSTAMAAGLTNLDTRFNSFVAAQATVGAKVNRLESLQDVNSKLDDSSAIALSKVEDVDFLKAAMDVGVQTAAYQAALAATAKVLPMSLVDFLS